MCRSVPKNEVGDVASQSRLLAQGLWGLSPNVQLADLNGVLQHVVGIPAPFAYPVARCFAVLGCGKRQVRGLRRIKRSFSFCFSLVDHRRYYKSLPCKVVSSYVKLADGLLNKSMTCILAMS